MVFGDFSLDTRVQDNLGEKPYRTVPGDTNLGLLILCDHATNRIPADYGTLGLEPEVLRRHIAYDPGAAGVVTRLAEALGAPAVLSCFSRLLVDPNRGLDDPTLIMQIADGQLVPGNVELTQAEREARLARFYEPYHQAVKRAVEAGVVAGRPPAIVSIHSFTENWKGAGRPWSAAVLWDKDPRLPVPLLEALRTIPDAKIGDNEPYSGQLKGDTLYRHATLGGLAHGLIELRQDLIGTEDGQAEWAGHLTRVLRTVMESAPDLNTIEHYGSHTGPHR